MSSSFISGQASERESVWGVLRDSPFASLVVDGDEERIHAANAASERLLGLSAGTLRGRPLGAILSGNLDRQSGTATTPDGTTVRLTRAPGGIIYLENITIEQRFASEWHAAFDSLESFVLVVDDELRILRANRVAQELFGDAASIAEIARSPLGRSVLGFLGSGRAPADLQRSTLVADEPTGRTWELTTVVRPFERFAVVIGTDSTRVVKLQEAIHHSEKTMAMGRLVAGVAHEVRNPLFSISAMVDAIEARFGEREDQRPFFDTLRESVDRLAALTRDLLEFGRPLDLRLEELALDAVLARARAACEPIAEKAGIKLVERVPADLLPTRVDPARMVQVLVNLVENAIQHSRSGQTVTLELVNVPAENGRAAAVSVTVHDSGPGIEPQDLSAIFLPFFSRRRGGIGMGLAIAQQIVTALGGVLSAANRPEGGAAFIVRLPASRGAVPAERRPRACQWP